MSLQHGLLIHRLDQALVRIDQMEPRIHGSVARNIRSLDKLQIELHRLKFDPVIEERISTVIQGCRQQISIAFDAIDSRRLHELREELQQIRTALGFH